MQILLYEEWMKPQVISLFVAEYGVTFDEFEELFTRFYESPFQKDHCVRIVAVEGEKVGGFQSFFYWPIKKDGVVYKTFQSGNSLVNPDFRGKGLFAKMLDFIHLPENQIEVDGLIGFPVEMSYGSFMRNKWKNPFNLQWHVKIAQPISSLFSNPERDLTKAFGKRSPVSVEPFMDFYFVTQSAEFDAYRFQFQQTPHWRYVYEEGSRRCLFEFKMQVRKKLIKELVIGKIVANDNETAFWQRAYDAFYKEVKRATSVTIISFACNGKIDYLQKLMADNGFRKIDRTIYFIAKGKMANEIENWDNWDIQRADIDTW